MTTELILLGTAGGPAPLAARQGISSAVVVGDRVFLVDCGRGAPSGLAAAGFGLEQLDSIFVSHLHADHVGDLASILLYGWGVRGSVPPLRVYGPGRASGLPDNDGQFGRKTVIREELPTPGVRDLVEGLVQANAFHFNVMPVDATMPDASQLVRAHDVPHGDAPVILLEDDDVRVTAVPVSHGHVEHAFAYRFDTADGSITFSGDTHPDDRLTELSRGADVLVHEAIDLETMREQGTPEAELEKLRGLHTDVHEVGAVAEEAGVGTLVLTHLIPPDPEVVPDERWADAARTGYSGAVVVGADGYRQSLGSSASR